MASELPLGNPVARWLPLKRGLMTSYSKFFLIHALGFSCVFLADKAFADIRSLDPKILSTVPGWTSAPVDPQVVEGKYDKVIAQFQGKPEQAILIRALDFIENNATKITNKNYLTLIDYSKNASQKRFYLIDLRTGDVSKYNVSNGKGSDANYDGIAESFSNEPESLKTSLGFYLTLDDYYSEKFESKALRLEGLSETNSLALDRAIVIHGAKYMDPEHGVFGRSFGCPALDLDVAPEVISKIKSGSLVLAFK
jgi:hypothetical protein